MIQKKKTCRCGAAFTVLLSPNTAKSYQGPDKCPECRRKKKHPWRARALRRKKRGEG